jgi:GT2 family glycosyltransferase
MRRQVHAVVVLRHRSDTLIPTLVGLAGQTRQPTTTTIVDLTGRADTEDIVTEHLRDTAPITYLRNKPHTGWSQAVNQARDALTLDTGERVGEGWMWLLRDDTEPAADALAHLFVAVDGAPSVVIAGPKQRMADQRMVLREFGETLTRWGQRQAIVDRELDQAQYDRMSDVLAVGDAGLLVNVGILDTLGGFDPALDPLDAPLDLCVRARLAGHRVLAVPTAITYVGQGPADWRAGKNLSTFALHRLDRTAWLYRRFVYSPWWALIPLILLALPVALARAVFQFVNKHPDTAIADLAATLQALGKLPGVTLAKARLTRSKKVSWSALRPLRMPSAQRRRRRQLQAEERFAQLEEKARLRSRPHFWPGGLWMTLGLGLLGVVLAGPLLSARALGGGGLLPLSPTLDSLWAGTRWVQPDSVQGMWGEKLIAADPAAILFALLGSLTWWAPSQAIVWLWAGAIVLAGLIAWWAGSQLLSQSMPTTVAAVLWAVSPTLLMALADGRIGAVIAHLVLPWLLATALTAHDSWQRAAQAGIATAVLVAAAPILWPAVLIGWIIVLVGTGWRTPLRTLLGTLPLAFSPALIWWLPRWVAPSEGPLLEGFGRWLADPGIPVAYEQAPWWLVLAGWPTDPTVAVAAGLLPVAPAILAVSLAVPLLVLALAVVATTRIDGMVIAATLIPLGLLTAVTAPAITQGFVGDSLVSIWSGTGVSLLTLGVVMAAAMTLDDLHPVRTFPGIPYAARKAGAWSLAVVTVAAAGIAGAGEATRHWTGRSPIEPLTEARLVPALVAADAPQYPRQGILIITDTGPDDPLRVSIERGAGPTLDAHNTLYRQRVAQGGPDADDLAFMAAALVQPTSDDPAAVLDRLDIRFVLYRGDTESPRALNISRIPALIPASQSEDSALWQLVDETVTETPPLPRTPLQAQWDVAWWILLALWGVLALPTERRPRHRSGDDSDEQTLSSVLEEPDDDQ